MVSLKRFDREFLFLERTDALQGREGGSEGGDHRYAVQNRFAADAILITPWNQPERGVDDQLNLSVLDQVGDIGPTFANAQDGLRLDPILIEKLSGSLSRVKEKSKFLKTLGDFQSLRLIGVLDAEKDIAFQWKRGLGRHLGLGEGHTEILVLAHDFSGAAHLRSQHDG